MILGSCIIGYMIPITIPAQSAVLSGTTYGPANAPLTGTAATIDPVATTAVLNKIMQRSYVAMSTAIGDMDINSFSSGKVLTPSTPGTMTTSAISNALNVVLNRLQSTLAAQYSKTVSSSVFTAALAVTDAA